MNEAKRDLQDLKGHVALLENKRDKSNGNKPSSSSLDLLLEVNEISRFHFRRWYTKVNLRVSRDFSVDIICLLDTEADISCIHEGIIPLRYFENTKHAINAANDQDVMTTHKLRNAHICKNGKCIQLRILQMKNMNEDLILGTELFISITPYVITT